MGELASRPSQDLIKFKASLLPELPPVHIGSCLLSMAIKEVLFVLVHAFEVVDHDDLVQTHQAPTRDDSIVLSTDIDPQPAQSEPAYGEHDRLAGMSPGMM